MASPDEAPQVTAADRTELRAWFEANHATVDGMWLVYWKVGSGEPSVTWSEAVDEALCFGWIDSKVQRIDDRRHRQWFTPRKPGSVWSRVNKDKIAALEADGRLADAGRAAVDAAEADGSWNALDPIEALEVPADLAEALDAVPARRAVYEAYPDSVKRGILWQVASAKRAPTRVRRIDAVVDATDRRERPFSL